MERCLFKITVRRGPFLSFKREDLACMIGIITEQRSNLIIVEKEKVSSCQAP